jgi:hypothetical protein
VSFPFFYGCWPLPDPTKRTFAGGLGGKPEVWEKAMERPATTTVALRAGPLFAVTV